MVVEVVPSDPTRSDKAGSRQAPSSWSHKGDSIPRVALQHGSCHEEKQQVACVCGLYQL